MEICRRPTNTGVGFRDFSKVWVALINISTRLKNINVIIDKVTLENIDIERAFLKTSIVHLVTLFSQRYMYRGKIFKRGVGLINITISPIGTPKVWELPPAIPNMHTRL